MRGVAFQESAVFPVPALGAKALILYSIHCVNRNLGALKHELAVYLAAVAGGFAAAVNHFFMFAHGLDDLCAGFTTGGAFISDGAINQASSGESGWRYPQSACPWP